MKTTSEEKKNLYSLRNIYLVFEFSVLFAFLPTLYVLDLLRVHIILLLLIVTAFCVFKLLFDKTFDKNFLWNLQIFRCKFWFIMKLFLVNALIISTFILVFKPSLLFNLPKQKPFMWLLLMIFYPLLSVYPQEIVYRTFFFHRYRSIFRKRLTMITASAVAFGYMHIVFENTIAVMLTLAGGFIFANTYDETRSTLAVVFEHVLYGCFIFTIGLGLFFYHGAVR